MCRKSYKRFVTIMPAGQKYLRCYGTTTRGKQCGNTAAMPYDRFSTCASHRDQRQKIYEELKDTSAV